jgi:hypothetical protein
MLTLTERCVGIKFCFKLGKIFTKTFEMLQKVFGNETMSRTRTYEWYRTSTKNDPSLGRPSASTYDSTERVQVVIRSN